MSEHRAGEARGLIFITLCAATVVGAAALLWWGATQVPLSPPLVEECVTASILVPVEDWVVSIGEQVICAKEWRWSGVYGPNLTTHIKSLQDAEAALRAELARWKDCARDARYCTAAMQEEMK